MTTLTSSAPSRGPESYAKLWELIKDIDIAMMTTVAESGELHSRPMATQQIDVDHAELWFFTSIDSPKVAEIYHDREIGLSYASQARQRYVSVSGRAFVVRDYEKANELWTPTAKVWFPLGVNDPHLALLRVEVDSAQFWDSPANKVVQLAGFAKLKLTGQTPVSATENVKVHVR
jgi:general stress protein 26